MQAYPALAEVGLAPSDEPLLTKAQHMLAFFPAQVERQPACLRQREARRLTDDTLDALSPIASLHTSSRPRRRPPPGAKGPSKLPPSLAHAGAPRAGLGGIADALALLPDLNKR